MTQSTQAEPDGLDDTAALRRADALFMEFDGAGIRVVNLLTRRSAVLTPLVLGCLGGLRGPTPIAEVAARLPVPAEQARGLLGRLTGATVLHRVGTPEEISDRHWAATWRFGRPAAALSFAHRAAADSDPAPPICANGPGPAVRHAAGEALPLPDAPLAGGVVGVMAERRSPPRFAGTPVNPRVLSRILLALAGRTGRIDTKAFGPLPLSLSPSAGARNPYEAYVFVNSVADVPPGAYHYDQAARTLLRLGDRPADMAALADGQRWAADAAFAVLLVAFLDRVWDKYPSPGGYLNVIIEAGHRAQNALLAATECRLGARMTTAIADDLVHRPLGLCPPHQTPVYLLAFGHPANPDNGNAPALA